MPGESASSERTFVDLNVFAYADDHREPVKRARPLALIRRLSEEGRMVVSSQVMSELRAIVLRGRLRASVPEEDVLAFGAELEASAEVLRHMVAPVLAALHAACAYRAAWSDTLIWAAAHEGECAATYT